MDKDANLNNQGRSVHTRLALLEARVGMLIWIARLLVGGLLIEVVAAVVIAYIMRGGGS